MRHDKQSTWAGSHDLPGNPLYALKQRLVSSTITAAPICMSPGDITSGCSAAWPSSCKLDRTTSKHLLSSQSAFLLGNVFWLSLLCGTTLVMHQQQAAAGVGDVFPTCSSGRSTSARRTLKGKGCPASKIATTWTQTRAGYFSTLKQLAEDCQHKPAGLPPSVCSHCL